MKATNKTTPTKRLSDALARANLAVDKLSKSIRDRFPNLAYSAHKLQYDAKKLFLRRELGNQSMRLIIADLDGTLFDNSARRYLIPKGRDAATTEGWVEFNRACESDTPITTMHKLLIGLHLTPTPDKRFTPLVAYVTGRGRQALRETVNQLHTRFNTDGVEYKLPSGSLYLRPAADNSPPQHAKKSMFAECIIDACDAIFWPHDKDDARNARLRFMQGEGIVFLEDDTRVINMIAKEYPFAVIIRSPAMSQCVANK